MNVHSFIFETLFEYRRRSPVCVMRLCYTRYSFPYRLRVFFSYPTFDAIDCVVLYVVHPDATFTVIRILPLSMRMTPSSSGFGNGIVGLVLLAVSKPKFSFDGMRFIAPITETSRAANRT